MREIKFRAWNLNTETMIVNTDYMAIGFNGNILEILPFETDGFGTLPVAEKTVKKYEPMQYTGLKDESGVEIYEGDVFGLLGGDVERPNEYEFHAKVYFDNDFSAFCVELYNGGWEYLSDYLDNPKNEREVIGNIYENPELVK